MKPIATINITLLADGGEQAIDQLSGEGYIVVAATEGPAVYVCEAPIDRRERIATVVLTSLVVSHPLTSVLSAIRIANALIEELDK